MNKLKALWASLPHPAQAVILAFVTAAGTTFLRAFGEDDCFSLVCLKQYAATSLLAGVATARAFYMVPNRPPAPPSPQA